MNPRIAAQAYAAHPEQAKEGQRQLHELLARSATDVDFRQKLLTDPRTAVSEIFPEYELPESWNVVFVENRADVTIVLPDPVDAEAELSEEELAAVAGGATTSPFCVVLATVYATLWVADKVLE